MNMKCKICQGCLKVMRIDREEQSYIFWYCNFCQKIFDFYGKRLLVENEELRKEVIEQYKELHGDRI